MFCTRYPSECIACLYGYPGAIYVACVVFGVVISVWNLLPIALSWLVCTVVICWLGYISMESLALCVSLCGLYSYCLLVCGYSMAICMLMLSLYTYPNRPFVAILWLARPL